MAARDVKRHRGRSLLVALLVGLPVMLSAIAATLISTGSVSVAESLPTQLGRSQASVSFYGGNVSQNANGDAVDTDGDFSTSADGDLSARVVGLTGGGIVSVVNGYSRAVIGSQGWDVDVLKTDLTSGTTRGMVVLESGRQAKAPDEVVVTKALAGDGATIGTNVVVGGQDLTVVGVGTVGSVGSHARARAVAVPETSVIPPSPADERSWLVDRRDPVTWDDVKLLNENGFVVISRSVVLDPSAEAREAGPTFGDSADSQLAAIVVMALVIEVILLAGPAFAVSVRRQRHELATVAAAGGSPRDLRRIILAQALVLGVGACVAGAALSIPVSWGVARILGQYLEAGMGPFDIAWPSLVLAVLLGVVASFVAALVPARQAARNDVVAALAGRVPAPRPSAGWPLVGALLMVVGFGGILSQRSEMGVAALTILTVIGAILLTPALIGLAARTAGRLPLPLRLAVRDADRQRARSAPAIAAIMASVSAVTALAIGSSSDAAETERDITYSAPLGAVTLNATTSTMAGAVAAANEVSGARFTPLPVVGDEEGLRQINAMVPDEAYPGTTVGTSVAVADAAVLRGWGVTITPAQQSALDEGGALVPFASMIDSGEATLQDYSDGMTQEGAIRLPAVRADLGLGDVPQGPEPVVAGAVISPATAERLGLPVRIDSARADRQASSMSISAVREAVIAAAPAAADITIVRERGSEYGTIFAILAVTGAIAVAIGSFSATGLALSDARKDLATLVAVGASPLTRRLVAGSQALVLALLGAVLGVAIGFVPGLAAARLLTAFGPGGRVIDVPWSLLAILVIGVPLAVAAITALVSRGRPPLEERGIA